jgi:hypothetical protein
VEFTSLGGKAPVLMDFYPKTATWYDTVTLIGVNLSAIKSKVIVKFNNAPAFVLKGSGDTVLVKVPFELTDKVSTVSIAMIGTVSTATEKFALKNPELNSVVPAMGVIGTIIRITGKNLVSSKTKVYFGEVEGEFVQWGQTFIEVKVPPGVTSGPIDLKVVTGAGELFGVIPFEVQD